MGPTYCAPGMVNLFFAEKLPWPGAIVACQSAAKKIYVSERSLTSKRSYDDPADARPAHPGENRAGDARALRREGRRSHHHWRHRPRRGHRRGNHLPPLSQQGRTGLAAFLAQRSEEHTSELQSLMSISNA